MPGTTLYLLCLGGSIDLMPKFRFCEDVMDCRSTGRGRRNDGGRGTAMRREVFGGILNDDDAHNVRQRLGSLGWFRGATLLQRSFDGEDALLQRKILQYRETYPIRYSLVLGNRSRPETPSR